MRRRPGRGQGERRGQGEEGSATIIIVALIACLLAIGGALATATFHLAGKGYASAVADLAALASAQANSCSAGAEVIQRNTAHEVELARCEVSEGYAQVQVHRPGLISVSVTARAGPTW